LADEPLETLTPADSLYRRLLPDGHVRPDGETVHWGAFLKKLPGAKRSIPDPELSVNLVRLTSREATLSGVKPGLGIGQFSASVPLVELSLEVQHAPLADNYAHTLVLGLSTLEQCKRLAEATRVIEPPYKVQRSGF
jgi:hypothetical protein